MKNILLLILLITVSFLFGQTPMSEAEAKSFIAKVTADSKNLKTLQADFVQTKKVSFMAKNAVSSGKMALQFPNLLSWKYTKPTLYSIVFRENHIYINNRGKQSSVDAKNKRFEKLNKLIVGTASGRLFNDPDFIVRYFKNGGTNIARFIPKSQTLLRYIKYVELSFTDGQSTVSQVNMVEDSGDATIINFKNAKVNAPIPADAFL